MEEKVVSGFHWWYPVVVAVLFLPAIFLYFNSSALIYAPVYGLVALFGNLIGGGIHEAVAKMRARQVCGTGIRKMKTAEPGARRGLRNRSNWALAAGCVVLTGVFLKTTVNYVSREGKRL